MVHYNDFIENSDDKDDDEEEDTDNSTPIKGDGSLKFIDKLQQIKEVVLVHFKQHQLSGKLHGGQKVLFHVFRKLFSFICAP